MSSNRARGRARSLLADDRDDYHEHSQKNPEAGLDTANKSDLDSVASMVRHDQ